MGFSVRKTDLRLGYHTQRQTGIRVHEDSRFLDMVGADARENRHRNAISYVADSNTMSVPFCKCGAIADPVLMMNEMSVSRFLFKASARKSKQPGSRG